MSIPVNDNYDNVTRDGRMYVISGCVIATRAGSPPSALRAAASTGVGLQ